MGGKEEIKPQKESGNLVHRPCGQQQSMCTQLLSSSVSNVTSLCSTAAAYLFCKWNRIYAYVYAY